MFVDISTVIGITLYPLYSRVDRENLVIRHSVLQFPKFWTHCVLNGGTQRRAFALLSERRNENNNSFEASHGARSESVSVNATATGCGFDPTRGN